MGKVSAFLLQKHWQGKCGRIITPAADRWVISWRTQRNSPSASKILETDPFNWLNKCKGWRDPVELMSPWLHQSRKGEHTTLGLPSPRFYSLINSSVKYHIVLHLGNLPKLSFTLDHLRKKSKVYSPKWINNLKWPILAASKRVLPSVSQGQNENMSYPRVILR